MGGVVLRQAHAQPLRRNLEAVEDLWIGGNMSVHRGSLVS
jgi:hypothetical protein